MKIKNLRWIIVTLLLAGTIINYFDRQIIGLLKPTLEVEFRWTETDFGRIMAAFSFTYAIGLLLSGRLIDKIGTKIGYGLAVVVWSVASIMHVFAKSVTGFGVARMLLGIGESGNFPAGMKAISEWFPKKEKGTATGIFNSGTAVGVIIALITVPLVLSRYGWKEVFWLTGILGLVWIVVWWLLYDLPSRHKKITPEEQHYIESDQIEGTKTDAKTGWAGLIRKKETWAVITGKFLIDPIFWFFLFWLPSYFSETFHLSMTRISPELMLIYSATTLGSIGGGYFSSVLVRRGLEVVKSRRISLLIFAVIELVTLISIARFLEGKWGIVIAISLAVAIHQAWATNVFTLASDMFPKEVVGSVVGIAGMMGAVGGILFPLFIGYLLDAYKVGGNIVGGYNLIFTICGGIYLLAWGIIYWLTKRIV